MIAQHALANSPDHSGVTPDQRFKRDFIALAEEALQELTVCGVDIGFVQKGAAELVQERSWMAVCHDTKTPFFCRACGGLTAAI
jgi:hypothetical protein